MDDVELILAGDIFQRHVIFGPRRPMALPGGLSSLTGEVIAKRAILPVPADLEAEYRPPARHPASGRGDARRLRRNIAGGDVVIAGSITPPLMLGADDRALTWELRPIGRSE